MIGFFVALLMMEMTRETGNALKSHHSGVNPQTLLTCLKSNPSLQQEYDAALQSLYRWWWECLRESPVYTAALRGAAGEPYAGMAADFGELREHFALWWLETGRFLFGQAVYPAKVGDIDAEHPLVRRGRMLAWHDEARPNLHLRIPLTLDKREAMRQVAELLDQALAKRQPEIVNASYPRRMFYPDQRIRLSSIKVMIQLWRERKTTLEDWWQTGERLGHWPQFTCLPDDNEAAIKHKRRLMTLTLQRLHKTAAKLIDYAARGDFPRVK